MKTQFIIIISAITIVLSACKKNDISVPNNHPGLHTGTVTGKGTPAGNLITKTIGSSGGNISSADVNILVTIPEGAVSTNTTFSIQPITNKTPNGLGLAYRLLPEGIHFNKDVTISFHYNDSLITGTDASLLYVAYQDTNGVWMAKKNASVNKDAKTISISSSHFSDWSLLTNYVLIPDENEILPNATDELTVKEIEMLGDLNTGNEVPVDTNVTDKKVVKWGLVYHEGDIYPSSSEPTAKYVAPGDVPQHNPVIVSAEIDNLESNEGSNGKVIIYANITIAAQIMTINIDGNVQTYASCLLFTNLLTSATVIQGGPSEDSIACLISITGDNAGTYNFTAGALVNNSVIVTSGSTGYFNGYADCDGSGLKTTDGTITIKNWNDVSKYIEGSVSGTLATGKRCELNFKPVYISFRALRMM